MTKKKREQEGKREGEKERMRPKERKGKAMGRETASEQARVTWRHSNADRERLFLLHQRADLWFRIKL